MKKVLILFGGNSYEHDISCNSVNFIVENIDSSLFDYSVVGIDRSNNWYEIEFGEIDKYWCECDNKKIDNIIEYLKKYDVVFPMIHGNTGEDGKLQSLFELYNIKYVGSDSYSSLISYDKYLTKLVVEKHGIPQVPYFKLGDEIKMKFPVIVKPSKCGSSIGISVSNNREELANSINEASKYDSNVIIEKFIENRRELECAILENGNELIVSNVGEIVVVDDWYDYNAKYVNNTETLISNIGDNIKYLVKEYSKKIFRILNCKGYARVDFLYDEDNNELYFNEINTIPGFTNISMYPKLMKNFGIGYKELITILLTN